MSMASLEKAILLEVRKILKNPNVKNKDLLAWSTSDDVKPDDVSEIVVFEPTYQVNVCLKKILDKR